MSSCVPWLPTPVSDMTRELSPFYASSDPTPSPPPAPQVTSPRSPGRLGLIYPHARRLSSHGDAGPLVKSFVLNYLFGSLSS